MNICVYGASSSTIDSKYIEAGERLGECLAKAGHRLVFGAGGSGLMGAVARGVYRAGGHITGIVPAFFNADGILFEHCDKMIKTETMRERKRNMEDLADAFIMTPGGVGTLDEFFEILTLKDLKRHNKPLLIYNTAGYYDSLIEMINKAVEQNFVMPECPGHFHVFTDPDELIEYISSCKKA